MWKVNSPRNHSEHSAVYVCWTDNLKWMYVRKNLLKCVDKQLDWGVKLPERSRTFLTLATCSIMDFLFTDETDRSPLDLSIAAWSCSRRREGHAGNVCFSRRRFLLVTVNLTHRLKQHRSRRSETMHLTRSTSFSLENERRFNALKNITIKVSRN